MINQKISKRGLNITINTTEDCNMRCKYCYEINKSKKSIDFDKCKKFIDLIISDDKYLSIKYTDNDITKAISQGLIIDFIGGDSLMNVSLCDEVLTYLVYKLNTTNNEKAKLWRTTWRASLSSNGTLFDIEKVKEFCEKWKNNLSLGVSIDGCPTIHDKNRIMNYTTYNGEEVGSMNIILKNWDWYKENFPDDAQTTKATCSKDTIPYLYDSLVFMYEKLGITHINQNFIMEDTHCNESDYKILVEQLNKCINYVLKHRHEMYWSMIDKSFTLQNNDKSHYYTQGQCGSGAMPTLAIDGKIYPCFRWLPHTQHSDGVLSVGNVDDGFIHYENFDKVRKGSIRANCTKEEKCKTCLCEPVCKYCIGGCYAEYNDFIRTTHICEITKIQVDYARRYWNEYNKLENITDENNKIIYLPIDNHYDVDKYYYDSNHIYNPNT